MTADGQTLQAAGIGDVCVDLPNGNKWTSTLLKNTVYTLKMTFTVVDPYLNFDLYAYNQFSL